MSRRVILLILVVGLMMSLAGCDLFSTSKEAATEEPAKQAEAVEAPATAVPPTVKVEPSPAPIQAEPSPVAKTAAEPAPAEKAPEAAVAEEPEPPELLDPPDEYVGTVIDLIWQWTGELKAGEWFELQIWPDGPDEEPEPYEWLGEKQLRVTSADLLPGRYLWRVAAVEGKEDDRGEEVSPWSEERVFIIVWPAIKGRLNITPVPPPTATPTNTPRPTVAWWPTAGPSRTPTATLSPTATVEQPAATPTSDGYPVETATNEPGETPSATPDGPTATPQGKVSPTPQPSATTDPATAVPSATPVQPTAVPTDGTPYP